MLSVKANVGTVDRAVRILLGLGLLSLLWLADGGIKYVGLLGFVFLATGIFRFCPLYPLFKINTCSVKKADRPQNVH